MTKPKKKLPHGIPDRPLMKANGEKIWLSDLLKQERQRVLEEVGKEIRLISKETKQKIEKIGKFQERDKNWIFGGWDGINQFREKLTQTLREKK